MGVPYMLKSEVKNIGKSLINELIDKEIIEEWNVHQNNSWRNHIKHGLHRHA